MKEIAVGVRGFAGSKALGVTACLALAVFGRLACWEIPNFQPVTAMVILTSFYFGTRSGVAVGALAAPITNIWMGQGSWTLFQSFSWALVGYTAGVLFSKGKFKGQWTLLVLGFALSMLFGVIMDTYSVMSYHLLAPVSVVSVYLAGVPFNLVHAFSTVMFLSGHGIIRADRSNS